MHEIRQGLHKLAVVSVSKEDSTTDMGKNKKKSKKLKKNEQKKIR